MVRFLLLKTTDLAIGKYMLCNIQIYLTVNSRLYQQMADHAKGDWINNVLKHT